MSNKQYNGKKRLIQSYFYHKSPTRGSIVALAGNNLDLHVNDFNHIFYKTSKAFVYDLSSDVITKFNYLNNKHVRLIHGNVLSCEPQQFMDIDLMKTLSTTQRIIKYLFLEQYYKFKNDIKEKTFMFTYCLRQNKLALEQFIAELKQYATDVIFNYEYKTYRDGAPMCTVQIIWQ